MSIAMTTRYDIIVAGGGMAGLTLGLALAQGDFSVALIEPKSAQESTADKFDGRASALAYANVRMLKTLGVWQHLGAKAQAINDILVSDASLDREASPLSMHFDHHEIGEPLGYMAENRHIRRALVAACDKATRLKIYSGLAVVSTERMPAIATAALSSGETISASLIVAADGRDSAMREAAGLPVLDWSYAQTGIVVTVSHEKPHNGVAYEHFLPSGPFAILPLPPDETGANRSSLVWTEPSDLASSLLALPKEEFTLQLARRFGGHLGPIAATGPRWSYPLSFRFARETIAHRLALIGDAAQAIHPIAGQGLNLGFKDVAALTETLLDAARLGSDIGMHSVLKRYARWRNFDRVALSLGTDALNRLFSNDIAPIRVARDLGLGAVDAIAPLRRFFMRQAGGDVGKLPRLLKGEAA